MFGSDGTVSGTGYQNLTCALAIMVYFILTLNVLQLTPLYVYFKNYITFKLDNPFIYHTIISPFRDNNQMI
jgi:hypothetical protein